MAQLTPFQTVGPYLHIGLRVGLTPEVGQPPVIIRGRLLDGNGDGIPDGILEWWHPSLSTLCRTPTDENGAFQLHAVKPLAAASGDGRTPAPHLAVRVLARGIQTQYLTRLYFADEPAIATDPILALVPESRRHTLIARPESATEYRFDVVVQGDHETVFFDI